MMQPDGLALHDRLNLSCGRRNSGGHRKISHGISPKRPAAAHGRQGYRPKNVGKMLLSIFYPLPRYPHPGGSEGGFIPLQQNQIDPPGIVPAGRFENLVRLGGMDEALGSEVGAGKKAGLPGVLPVVGFSNAVKHFV